MDGVDCDWCLVCEKHTSNGAAYCSTECRSQDLISSSASSSSSSASTSSSGPTYFAHPGDPSAPAYNNDNYPMPPFVRKQRTSIPNIYAHCTANPNPPMTSLMFTPGGHGSSVLTHHLQQQQCQQHQQQHPPQSTTPPSVNHPSGVLPPGSAASQYPLFYATLNALRPATPTPHDRQ
ncbi:hypothetical protein BG011_004161 [Mortierella polycephala]|uniref:Uncharacterized protein n=1 Tax=Mortierella polycephala TaxID=41804 RepID=A0A9P6U2R8_9FUNG|nr:hypothetical protein BG011_004161 [Mortierella polycephala]